MKNGMFIGRQAEVRLLSNLLQGAVNGQPRIVLITGEAGLGKSTLIEHFKKTKQAQYKELIVACGYCNSHFGQTDPLHPFRSISSQLFTEDKEKQTENKLRLAQKAGDVLWEIAPDIIDVFVPFAGLGVKLLQVTGKAFLKSDDKLNENNHQAKTILFEQYSQLLFWASEQFPLLLIIEDLHWADKSTIEFLFHLARSWQNQRILVLGTYRASEVRSSEEEHYLLRIQRDLIRYDLCQIIRLEWLIENDIHVWLNTVYPKNTFIADFAHQLHQQTKGNPFFISEILKDLQELNVIFKPTENSPWQISSSYQGIKDLPPTVSAVLEQRLSRLNEKLRKILTCASIEGEQFTAEIIARVRKLDEEEVIDTLLDILSKKLEIVEFSDEHHITERKWVTLFEFRHSLMKDYLYEQLIPPQKRRLHQKVGECLELFYAEQINIISPELARHFSEASLPMKSLKYALLATDLSKSAYDYDLSKYWLNFALNQLNYVDLDKHLEFELIYKLGKLEESFGHYDEAITLFHELGEQISSQQSPELAADIFNALAFCFIQTDNSSEAILLLKKALLINKKLNRLNELGYNLVNLAFAYHRNLQQELSKSYLLLARNIFRLQKDSVGLAFVRLHLGIHYRIIGKLNESLDELYQAVEMFQNADRLIWVASCYTNLGSTFLTVANDNTKALYYYQKSIEISRKVSAIHEEGHVLLNVARVLALKEMWTEALDQANQGLRLANIVKEKFNIIRGHWYRGLIRYNMGNKERAIKDFEYLLTLGINDAHIRWGIYYNFGSLYQGIGKLEDAVAMYIKACETLLAATQNMHTEERENFLLNRNKLNVFYTLSKISHGTRYEKKAILIMNQIPEHLQTTKMNEPLRFYWGGNLWS